MNHLVLVSCTVWLLSVLAYVKSPVVTSFDSRWVVLQSLSLLRHGDLNLDEYRSPEYQPLFDAGHYSVYLDGIHYHSIYPAGVPVLAAPFVWAAEVTGANVAHNPVGRLSAELVIASVLTAAAATVVFALSHAVTGSVSLALLIWFVFTFGTSAWSVASRGLWQHGPSLLFVSAAIYALIRSDTSPRWLWLCGFCVAAAYTVRPANSVVVVAVSVYVALQFRWNGFRSYLCAALPVALALLAYNLSVYRTALSPYYMGYAVQGHSWYSYGTLIPGPIALAGHLVSPSHGLLIYSPVFLVSFYSMFRKVKGGRMSPLDWLACSAVLGLWVVISMPKPWWGGHCYGPRLFSDALPWLTLIMATELRSWTWRSKRAALFAMLVLASTFTHFKGATSPAAYAAAFGEQIVWSFAPQHLPFLQR